MEYLQANFPLIAVLIFVLKEPIIKTVGAKFPFLVSAWVDDKIDRREYGQEKDTLLLQEKLRASEFNREQSAGREKEYINILKGMVNFSQEIWAKQIVDTENTILSELKLIRKVLIKLSEQN